MSTNLHETDFYTWTQTQARLLREGRLHELDTEHLIEELESMGASERRALGNQLTVLLAHLLKWRYQPERRSSSSRRAIRLQRMEIADLLAENPGLGSQLEPRHAASYLRARIYASDETGMEEDHFPAEPPFTVAQTLDSTFWPEP